MHQTLDRVKETSTTTGTGNLTLAGAVSKFRSFSTAAVANNDTFYYGVEHATADEWEVGLGTYVSATPAIARTTVLASSNAGAAVNFSAGDKSVFITEPSRELLEGSALGMSWGRRFFREAGILPATERIAPSLVTVPAGGTAVTLTATLDDGHARFSGSMAGVYYWDLGSLKSELLIVIGGMTLANSSMGIIASASAPVSADPNHYGFYCGAGSYAYRLFKDISSVFTQIGSDPSNFGLAPVSSAVYFPWGMAFHYKDSTDTLTGYVQVNGKWIKVTTGTDTALTTLRYVGFRVGAATSRLTLPLVVFSD